MTTPYTIRESARAKHVRLRVSAEEGVVVVVPKGFERHQIPNLVERKRQWIERALAKIAEKERHTPSPAIRPDTLDLAAIDQIWTLEWVLSDASRVTVRQTGTRGLQIQGSVESADGWQAALRRWVIKKGKEHLEPWVQRLSDQLHLPIKRVTVRCQKTRWGSYSTNGTLSLNAQLLFLPRRWARYVLLHELCHVAHPDHSPAFWGLLIRHEPDAVRIRDEMRVSHTNLVPSWLRMKRQTRP